MRMFELLFGNPRQILEITVVPHCASFNDPLDLIIPVDGRAQSVYSSSAIARTKWDQNTPVDKWILGLAAPTERIHVTLYCAGWDSHVLTGESYRLWINRHERQFITSLESNRLTSRAIPTIWAGRYYNYKALDDQLYFKLVWNKLAVRLLGPCVSTVVSAQLGASEEFNELRRNSTLHSQQAELRLSGTVEAGGIAMSSVDVDDRRDVRQRVWGYTDHAAELLGCGQKERALRVCQCAAEKYADYFLTWLNLGAIEMNEFADVKSARPHLEKALALNREILGVRELVDKAQRTAGEGIGESVQPNAAP